MEAQQFQALVARVERLAEADPKGYVLRVFAIAALGFVILGLVIAMAMLNVALIGGVVLLVVFTGGKALLFDFNYDVQPLPGKFPVPHVGPMTLMEETRANHAGKKAFSWAYWNLLLPGHLPMPSAMSMAGKHDPTHSTGPAAPKEETPS